jgi:response regulator RpfG family c-di-GMP phosphodiesterase
VADAYDAMTSARPYRDALSREQALAEIRLSIGRQFDPVVANAFLEMSAADITPRRKKVLVTDDELSIRLLTKSVLGNEYAVIEAGNGREAVEVAQSQQPDLIFMDIHMPESDGLQACYEIKANLATKEIPVVMLTAMDLEMNKRLAADLGPDGCITKPFTPGELLDTVARFLKSP